MTKEELSQIIDEVDQKGTHQIEFDDFCQGLSYSQSIIKRASDATPDYEKEELERGNQGVFHRLRQGKETL